jgi:hypothetical protein
MTAITIGYLPLFVIFSMTKVKAFFYKKGRGDGRKKGNVTEKRKD